MSTTTIRISDRTHRIIARMARRAGVPMTEVVDEAVELLRRKQIADAADAAYAALRSDPAAWSERQAELAAWDTTLSDGLDGDRSE